MTAYLLLEDGTRLDGDAVGAEREVTGEVVFTTGMSGYQESMTDPSFARQLITFTAPHVGNYGVSEAAMESGHIHAAAAIMRDAVNPSDAAAAEQGWLDWLRANGVPGISGVDTRALVRHIRDAGAMRGGIFSAATPQAEALERVHAEPSMIGRDLAREVTVREPEVHGDGDGPRIIALDTGIKRSIIRNFTSRGAVLELYPCTTPARELLERDPDGFFLVPGPGDPAALDYIVETIRELLSTKPVFGICLGHQLLSRAAGLETFKLPFGHRGANHPVKDLRTGRIAITSQNHGFAVRGEVGVRIESELGAAELTHVNLYDGTVEGIRLLDVPAGCVQYHPEAGPGPNDSLGLFDEFIDLFEGGSRLMPRRDDIQKILVLGSGPIVIGQAAEFDYSGAQACKVLLEEGYEVVLVNSNPATIMTDPEFATATYVEPLLPGPVAQVIEREQPDALLPTLGGQTALNLAKTLHEDGTLACHGVELIGANYDAINRAEDREQFDRTMQAAGLRTAKNVIATSVEDAISHLDDVGLPAIIRPAFTLGGRGGGIARTREQYAEIVGRGLAASPIGQVLIDESVLGWGEFELEVMRDGADNVVIVCSIENIDPMGVHTGDSVTVAPQQTLTDRLYQKLRDQAIAVIRAVGVETGGSNVQFAVNPVTEEIIVIEMNPRVSRSSALASKATGFPIAKIAARLAVGYTLDEIPNDITRRTPASFEPALDYVVVKWPRFAFEKFPGADATLSTHMKSVGEAMAIGRTFRQAFAKAMRSRELDAPAQAGTPTEALLDSIQSPGADRYDAILELLGRGVGAEEVRARTGIDPWYLRELALLATEGPGEGTRTFRAVDTCAAEFEAETPYYYSAWERGEPRHEVVRGDKQSVMILGSGPNRIGQGIEFDYCCVHAAMTVRESGRDAVMVNCNPETVSTDYDTSDRLYFEPLTLEDVLGIVEVERPEGVIVQFGGQTPLKLAAGLERAGVPLLGTQPEAIDLAEDRGRFGELLGELGLKAPPYGTAHSRDEALACAAKVGFPLLVRPSYVLGGRAMEIVYSTDGLEDYLERTRVGGQLDFDHAEDARPEAREIFLDRFLENAIEVDVDAICDGEDVWIGGIMQHVEEAGIHSGDSACVLPPHSLGGEMLEEIRRATRDIALALGTVGLINVQYGVLGEDLYVIEANPRASRTVPFVSKATGLPLAKLACRVMLGERLADLGLPEDGGWAYVNHVSVKEAVMPFDRFSGADALLGPEMRSTGEVMGVAADFPAAFAKAQAAAGARLPSSGTVFLTVTDSDKAAVVGIAAQLHDLGFQIVATRGTAAAISRMGIPVERLSKLGEGSPNVVDLIERGDVDLVINTPTGTEARTDGWEIRRTAVARGVPCITTVSGGMAAARAIAADRVGGPPVVSLQELHRNGTATPA